MFKSGMSHQEMQAATVVRVSTSRMPAFSIVVWNVFCNVVIYFKIAYNKWSYVNYFLHSPTLPDI